MNDICGFYSSVSDDDASAALLRMLGSGDEPATRNVMISDRTSIAVRGGAHLIQHGDLRLALIGHPRLRLEQSSTSDPARIAAEIGTRWTEALPAIGGDFALTVWDTARRRGLLVVDRIGVRQLFYAPIGEGLAFASSLDALVRHPQVSRELSPQALYDYLYFHVCPGPQTIFRDALRLAPAHYLAFGPGGHPEPRRYWSLNFTVNPSREFAALKAEFLALLTDSVATAATGARTGAFLSGGTDSSTVSGMLGRVNGTRPPTFSIGFDAAGYDEMAYARISASHFDCDHHEYYVTPADVVAAAPRIASYYDQPFGNASAIPTYYCARLAREHGIERLLAGDGGDELFGGNERYAKHRVLSLYQGLPRGLRLAIIEPLVFGTPLFKDLPGLKKIHSYVRQASLPMPTRYAAHNLLTHLQPENILTRDFLASVDTKHPLELLDEAHAPFRDADLINQMLGIDLRFTLADSDLPKVTRMCELAGVDVAFPLLHESIVEFSAALPAEMKLRGTTLRWFFKKALDDFLPHAVITKEKHGFGLPVGTWLTSHRPLLDLADDGISALRQRRIVRTQFVEELHKRLLPAHPAYYGTMSWILMMLGLWLEARGA